jgi:hypothetical protein
MDVEQVLEIAPPCRELGQGSQKQPAGLVARIHFQRPEGEAACRLALTPAQSGEALSCNPLRTVFGPGSCHQASR